MRNCLELLTDTEALGIELCSPIDSYRIDMDNAPIVIPTDRIY